MGNRNQYVGKVFLSADGSGTGIYIVGYLPEVDDFIVMTTNEAGNILYSLSPWRIDCFKASYRYIMGVQ